MFTHRHIVCEILLVNSAKRTQKVSQRLPQAFNRVDVNFTDAITIIVSGPFFLPMTDCCVTTVQPVVAKPFVAVTSRVLGCELLNVLVQGRFVRSFANTQATLSTAASNGADDGRTIILISSMPALFIGAPTRWISSVFVLFSFFPPRSETSRQFQFGGLARASLPASYTRSLAIACASYERSGETAQALRL